MYDIFDAFGAETSWDGQTQTITSTLPSGDFIMLSVGSNTAYINEVPVILDAPTVIVNGRTLVPLRFIAEAAGATIEWVSDTRTVLITSPAPEEARVDELYETEDETIQ